MFSDQCLPVTKSPHTTTLLCGNAEWAKTPRHHLFTPQWVWRALRRCGDIPGEKHPHDHFIGGDCTTPGGTSRRLNIAQRCLLPSGGMGFLLHAHLLPYFGAEGSNGRRRLSREERRWMNRQRTQRTRIFTSYFPQNGRTQKPLITSEHIPVFLLWRNLANT